VRVHRIPYSTNVERVALALAYKGIDVEWVDHDPADRAAIRALSGQNLVPVLEADDGDVVIDSTAIVEWLERFQPLPALYPADSARRAEVEVFVEWFNRVWKTPPNAIEAELRKPVSDPELIAGWSADMRRWLGVFERLLDGREHLLSDDFGAADVCAFPFLKYALLHRADDDELFHLVLAERLALDGGFPRLQTWIRRVDARPRA
jgi:glutathione S-transferase